MRAPHPAQRRAARSADSAHRQERQHQAQDVFPFGDPGHRFDHHRVDGEDGCGQPSARHFKTQQEPPKEHGRRGVQEHVHQVIAYGVEAPQVILEPVAGVHQWIILLRSAGHEPHPPQAVHGLQRQVLDDVVVVVPHEIGP